MDTTENRVMPTTVSLLTIGIPLVLAASGAAAQGCPGFGLETWEQLGEAPAIGSRSVDIESDGDLDVMVFDLLGTGRVTTLFGAGDGAPSAVTTAFSGLDAFPALVADFNGDGFADIVFAENPPAFSVSLGDGAGGFGPRLGRTVVGADFARYAAGDANGDGRPDLAVWTRESDAPAFRGFTLMMGQGDGRFEPGQVIPTGLGWGYADVLFGDLDGDGDDDLVAWGSSLPDRVIHVWLNDGGVFAGSPIAQAIDATLLTDFRMADLDGDGDQDLVGADRSGYNGSGIFRVYRNTMDDATPEAFSQETMQHRSGGSLLRGTRLVLIDSDSDGDLDIFATGKRNSNANPELWRYDNNGAGAFEPDLRLDLPTPFLEPVGLHSGDFDGNGSPDLLAVWNSDNNDPPVSSYSLHLNACATLPCNDSDLVEPFGTLDLGDIAVFVAAFVAQDPVADVAPPAGVFDMADLAAFVDLFLAGCPG